MNRVKHYTTAKKSSFRFGRQVSIYVNPLKLKKIAILRV